MRQLLKNRSRIFRLLVPQSHRVLKSTSVILSFPRSSRHPDPRIQEWNRGPHPRSSSASSTASANRQRWIRQHQPPGLRLWRRKPSSATSGLHHTPNDDYEPTHYQETADSRAPNPGAESHRASPLRDDHPARQDRHAGQRRIRRTSAR